MSQTEKPMLHENRHYKRQVLRYVEAELYAYPWRKREIDRLRTDIIESTPEHSGGLSATPGDPTLARTMRLLTSRRLTRLAENFDAITRVYERLDSDRKRLVNMRYWQREYTDFGIYRQLHISRRTYYRWMEQVLSAMAVEMGLL